MKAGQVLAILEEQSIAATLTADDPDDGAVGERADLAEYHARRALLDDEARPEAIAKVHARGRGPSQSPPAGPHHRAAPGGRGTPRGRPARLQRRRRDRRR